MVCLWSPFVRCFVYIKTEVRFMHSSDHYIKQLCYLTSTKHDSISVECIFKYSTLVTGQKQGTVYFPSASSCQGQLQTVRTVSVHRHFLNVSGRSYVYWTVHHLDSWIKTDQLDVTCFIISLFTAQRVSNVSTSIFRSLRLNVDIFHVLYCSGSMFVGVTVWFGLGGVVSP